MDRSQMERLFDCVDALIGAEEGGKPTEVLTAAMFDAINKLSWEHYDGKELAKAAKPLQLTFDELGCMRLVLCVVEEELKSPGTVKNMYEKIEDMFWQRAGWDQANYKHDQIASSTELPSGPFSEILEELGLTRKELRLRAESDHEVQKRRLTPIEEADEKFYRRMHSRRRKRVEDPLASIRHRKSKRHRGVYRVNYDEDSSDECSLDESLIKSDVEKFSDDDDSEDSDDSTGSTTTNQCVFIVHANDGVAPSETDGFD
ncbi:hypothetical protein F5Y08DRAFT_350147 [Xylaria arbuscula]|nr:hypothetical protein F5Y08DRAFT_350147 [Xylaria arbuscula]